MAQHRPQHSATSRPSGNSRRRDGARAAILRLDAFVAAVYLPHVRLRKRSWRVDERIARQRLSPAFGARRLDRIRRGEVEDWLRDLAEEGLCPATCNRILAVFKSVCSLAMLHGVLPAGQSPCADVPPFKIHLQRERYLAPDEAQRLMRELERSARPEAAAIRLLLLTGARKSEILKARWENVRLDLRLLTVPLSKSGKPRHLPLSDAAVAVIRALPRGPGCPWLFPAMRRASRSATSIFSGTGCGAAWALPMCASMTCGTPLPAFWSMPGTRSMRCKNCWGTAIPEQLCATPIWGRPPCWRRPRASVAFWSRTRGERTRNKRCGQTKKQKKRLFPFVCPTWMDAKMGAGGPYAKCSLTDALSMNTWRRILSTD